MIRSFRHKGLEKFYKTGSTAGIQPAHAAKLRVLLTALDAAGEVGHMNMPAWRLHALSGSLKDHWSVRVNGNWRLTFRFENGHAEVVDYQDYH